MKNFMNSVNYPWTNLDNKNLDWFINAMQKLYNDWNAYATDLDSMKNWLVSYLRELDIVGVAKPENYGAKGDGITDDTEAFNRALNENDFIFCYNTYKVNNVTLKGGKHICFGKFISDGVAFEVNHGSIEKTGGLHFADINAPICIKVSNGRGFLVSSCVLRNYNGITIISGNEILVDSTWFYAPDGNNKDYAIDCRTADCHFTNCIIHGYKFAINNGGYNVYTNVHAWVNKKSLYEGSIFARSDNGLFEGCYIDTYYRGFSGSKEGHLKVINCKFLQNNFPNEPNDTLKSIPFYISDADNVSFLPWIITGCEFTKASDMLSHIINVFSYGHIKVKYDFNNLNIFTDDSINKAEHLFTVTSSNYTLTQNCKYLNGLVYLDIEFDIAEIKSGDNVICTVPDMFKITKSARTFCTYSDSMYASPKGMTYCNISNNGNISVKLPSVGHYNLKFSYPL